MLEPQVRISTYDIVRPPTGYILDALVVTTYSASLDTILSLPAAMLVDTQGRTDRPAGTISAAELAALKRVCDRTVVFCQMGGIYPAQLVSPAIIEAEDMVREAIAPNGGSFHPKVWIVRFCHTEGKRDILRVAVMSRNLTADRSWDAGVIMEGTLGKSPQKPSDLGSLLRHLANSGPRPIDPKRRNMILTLAADSERVRWKAPTGKGHPEFHLIGDQQGRAWRQPASDRLAIISPFLTASAVSELSKTASSRALILSRADALTQCWPSVSDRFERQMVLSPPGGELGAPSAGLHAKALIWQKGSRMRVAIGSMNATRSAISGRNVEFMVSFECPAAAGFAEVDDLLMPKNLGTVVEDFEPPVTLETPPVTFDDRPARNAVIAAHLHMECVPCNDGWSLALVPGAVLDDDQLPLHSLRFRPVTLSQARASQCGQSLRFGKAAPFQGTLELSQITGFTAFEADGPDGPFAFVLNLEVRGVDEGERRTAALKSLLPNERSFAEFLRTMLGDFQSLENTDGGTGDGSGPTSWGSQGQSGLLEMLIRCAADEPTRLKSIVETFEALGEEQLAEVTTAEFRQLWAALLHSAKQQT
ncbi:phospholipase D family protein [Rhizobium leguminosarum]